MKHLTTPLTTFPCGCGQPICKKVFIQQFRSEGRFEPEEAAELLRVVNNHDVLVEALHEADPTHDFDIPAVKKLADAVLNGRSLMGGQKEAVASLLQQYARFIRVARNALISAGEKP